ncbi:hypothetical protein A176_006023 [Myxococcus hansupus]|uniref:Uncharacterized protein n=1 Tax=Pseudomyxococcus hansupus TaxID=1297742 RepID=A0A0H4X077_9BACT|nr:hypothetical protein A176_006023 [Myxococcus hansupus]
MRVHSAASSGLGSAGTLRRLRGRRASECAGSDARVTSSRCAASSVAARCANGGAPRPPCKSRRGPPSEGLAAANRHARSGGRPGAAE